jgi:anti-anti-sigma factor
MLSINVERVGNTAVLHCSGRIVVGERLPALKEAVLCKLDKSVIVLDLAGVDAIDAGGLGLLVFLHICAHGLGTDLQLRAPSAQVAAVLELTRLHTVFTILPLGETNAELATLSAQGCYRACA